MLRLKNQLISDMVKQIMNFQYKWKIITPFITYLGYSYLNAIVKIIMNTFVLH